MNSQTKTVLITGGATGIGAATAARFCDKGYRVVITCHETQSTLTGVEQYPCDLTDTEEIRRLFDAVGTVDVLVNNAGTSLIKMINDTTEEDYDRVNDLNAKAVYFCAKYAALQMLKKHSGAIVNVSSMWGQCGASCETAYSMSKAAVIGFTKALAQELAPSGITVNCVCPGIIDTRMNAPFDRQELAAQVPLGRLGTPDEVADAIVFLAENPYITAQILGVNGGIV